MKNSTDMTTPVTRGELREELALLEHKLEQKLEHKLEQKLEHKLEQKLEHKLEQKLEHKLEQKLEHKLEQKLAHLATKAEIANLATKADLETWGGALMARMDKQAEESRRALSAELARHTRAAQEATTRELAVIDDKYADLPRRVSRLEDKMLGSKPP